MLTNRHKRTGITRRAAEAAFVWSCARVSRRDAVVAAAGSCLSPSAAYLLGGEPGLQGANSINDPRFMDQNNQT
jgi:hypothetical protein